MKSSFALALLLAAAPAFANPPQLPAFPPLDFKPPKGERIVLANGIKLFLLENHELPVIEAQALIRAGNAYDPQDKIGLAGLAAESLRAGGSKSHPADKMNETLEYLGASVESDMGQENGSASLWCLSKDFDTVLDVFADMLRNPSFEAGKVEVERQKMIEEIRRRNDEPAQVARREARRRLYGAVHPYGWRAEVATLQAVSLDDLRAFHARYYRPQGLSIAVAGDFKSADMKAKLEKAFGDWQGGGVDLPRVPAPPDAAPRKVYLAAKPVTQASVRILQFGFPRHSPDRFAYEVLNDVLGGNAFVSRLFTRVRSRLGLAYSVGSFFSEPMVKGAIGAACGTKNETVAQAIAAVQGEIRRIRDEKVAEGELQTAKDSIVQSFVFRYQTPMQIIGQRMSLEYFGYPEDYLDTYVDNIKKVTAEDVQKTARAWLKPEQALIYVVGDPSKFDEPLEKFGPVVREDAN